MFCLRTLNSSSARCLIKSKQNAKIISFSDILVYFKTFRYNFYLALSSKLSILFLLQGYLQNFYVVSGQQNGHRHQCPSTTDLACPTCGEFRQLQDVVKSMQEQYLQHIQLLEKRLEATEARLSKVEECDCHKSCRLPGGLIKEDGASWSSDQCQLCSCVVSKVTIINVAHC